MLTVIIYNFASLFVLVFNALVVVRVILSWLYPDPGANAFTMFIFNTTEPLLAPVRRILPRSQFIDFSPIFVFFLLQIGLGVLNYLLGA
jgi:YggT family protein